VPRRRWFGNGDGPPTRRPRRLSAGGLAPARLASALVALLVAAACGEAGSERGRALARFDFEETGWFGEFERTGEAPHAGESAGLVAIGIGRTTAWSPLIPLEGARSLEFTWWDALEVEAPGSFSLWAHFYVPSDLEHPAVPDFPRRTIARRLHQATATRTVWTEGFATLEDEQIPEDARWLRLELRLTADRTGRSRMRIDDVLVRAFGHDMEPG